MLDEDRSGALSPYELGRLLRSTKLERTPAQIKAILDEADPNQSGDVDFEGVSRVPYRVQALDQL